MSCKYHVITDTSSISPLGTSEDTILQRYRSARHYLSLKEFNQRSYYVGALPERENEIINNYRDFNKSLSRVDRSVLLAVAVSQNLIEKSGSDIFQGLCISLGSSRGATELWESYHKSYLNNPSLRTDLLTSPLTTMAHLSTEVAAFIGSGKAFIDNSTTCSTGIQSLINGLAWLKAGYADTLLTGATEAPLTPFTLAQVGALKIYNKDNTAAFPCMPLSDKPHKKNSFALGEGAAVQLIRYLSDKQISSYHKPVIIESVGFSFVKPPSYTGIDEKGTPLKKSMQMALKNQLTNHPVDLVLVHAPGTVKGDEAELQALKDTFGSSLPNIFSNKWVLGHTYAASASLNIELACLVINNQLELDFPYPASVINKRKNVKKVMVNATGFGGNAASIILSCPSIVL